MTELSDFAEPGRENDRVIQMALREMDEELMAQAMQTWSEDEREIVFRNMSERAVALLREHAERAAAGANEREARTAARFFVQKLVKYRRYQEREPPPEDGDELPRLSFASERELADSLVRLCRFAHVQGFLALEEIEPIEHPIARKGVELAIDGWDPMLIRTILERMKRRHLERIERQADMVVEAIEAMAGGESPAALRVKLMSYVD